MIMMIMMITMIMMIMMAIEGKMMFNDKDECHYDWLRWTGNFVGVVGFMNDKMRLCLGFTYIVNRPTTFAAHSGPLGGG